MTLGEHAAKKLALRLHAGQKYSGEDYAVHLQEVVDVLREYGFGNDDALVCAGWLHDSIEDTAVTADQIEFALGGDIASIVEGVTDELGKSRGERKWKTYPKIRENSRRVALKLADRIANVRRGGKLLPMYAKEHEAFRSALYRDGEFGSMWGELDALLGHKKATA